VTRKTLSPKQIQRGKETVKVILDHHFGARSAHKWEVKALAGGATNHVFSVRHAKSNLIVRLGNQPGKLSDFMKEQWAIATARENGVPGPEVLQVGHEPAPVPYMIAHQATGEVATDHPGRLSIVRELGRYAAIINSIPTEGFGCTFDWSHNQLTKNQTWGEFLKAELKVEEKLQIFEKHKMLEPPQIARLRSTLERMAKGDRTTCLNHGDLRLKNVLVNEKGKILCILDWEHCMSNLAPEWDLSLALHDLSIDSKQEFLAGYGLTTEQIMQFSPAWKAITMINYSGSVERAAKEKDVASLNSLRIRLSGALDLFSL
jgi:aminoglycoside phosphotransferase (APT) family kinase protein